ncbi:chloramphenicol phosphotransferase CPT family protein [Streptomyces sp. BYX5S]
MPQVIVLNGGSSSGKTSIARSLQTLLLPTPWLTLSVDTLIESLPPSGAGIEFEPDGTITVGPAFTRVEDAWMAGVAAMATAGAHVIVDEVFLGGPHTQSRWRNALTGLNVLWVGVHCDPHVATSRETARGDRTPGMAASQARLVHEGVTYDVVVDTSRVGVEVCAGEIAERVGRG